MKKITKFFFVISHLVADCLKNQVVWITGASYGIGAACALEAAKHGAKVVISARSEQQLEDVKRKCIGKVPFMNDVTQIWVFSQPYVTWFMNAP